MGLEASFPGPIVHVLAPLRDTMDICDRKKCSIRSVNPEGFTIGIYLHCTKGWGKAAFDSKVAFNSKNTVVDRHVLNLVDLVSSV